MKLHWSVTFEPAWCRDAVCLRTRSSTKLQHKVYVMCWKVHPARVFRTVDKNCKHIATKSRNLSLKDKQFTSKEVIKFFKNFFSNFTSLCGSKFFCQFSVPEP